MAKKKSKKDLNKAFKDLGIDTKKATADAEKALEEFSVINNHSKEAPVPTGYISLKNDEYYRLISAVATARLVFESSSSLYEGVDKLEKTGKAYSNLQILEAIVNALDDTGIETLTPLTNETDYLVTRYQHLLNEEDLEALADSANSFEQMLREALEEQFTDPEDVQASLDKVMVTNDVTEEQ